MKVTKRIFVMMLALIMTAGAANAQFKYGIKAGLNVNKLKFSQDAMQQLLDPKNNTGWTAGVMVEYTVPIIGIAVDASVMYTRMNNGTDGDVTILQPNSNKIENIYGKNFIEIPINLKYKLTIPAVASIIKPYIFTGPTFAFKLDKDVFKNVKTKTTEVAWNVGLGVELIRHLQVGASYGFGINNIADKVWKEANTQQVKLRNNYWTVTAAYLF